MRRPRAQAALVLLPLLAGGCFSSSYELDGTAAFSRVDVDGAAGDERADGYRLAGNFSSALFTPGFLRAGQGNGLRGNVNLAYSKHDDNEYAVWSPQVGPSFRLGLGGLFVEPGSPPAPRSRSWRRTGSRPGPSARTRGLAWRPTGSCSASREATSTTTWTSTSAANPGRGTQAASSASG